MRKLSLLEMTQNILSALDSDEVNSIGDTVESQQVAEVVRETYYEQFNNILVPELRGLIQLESLNSLESPNYLRFPTDVAKIESIRYRDYRRLDDTHHYATLTFMDPELFLDRHLRYSHATEKVMETIDPSSGVRYPIYNDRSPRYFTMFDDQHIATDAFDDQHESFLTTSSVVAYGWKAPIFELEDDFIPPLDGNMFPLLLSEAKSTAFINLKQISSSKEEQRARRQRIRMQNDKFREGKAQQDSYRYRGFASFGPGRRG